jgi:uncharacterized protein YndB with AHSA1/START domain
MTERTIEKSIYIAASPETVWSYLTKSSELAKWFHKPDENLNDGEAFDMKGKDGSSICGGTVERMDPHSHLTYTFTAGPMNGLITKVAWTLADVPGGTRLSLVHTGFPAAADAFGLLAAFDKGWDGHLIRLREIES